MHRSLNTFLFLLLCSALVNGQDGKYYVTKLSEPIDFEGRVDEESWQDIAPFPLKMSSPVQGGNINSIQIKYSYTFRL